MKMGRIFENCSSAILLWRKQSNTHYPIPAGNVFPWIATIVDQGAVAKPPAAYSQQE
jgi:hypothetical protein